MSRIAQKIEDLKDRTDSTLEEYERLLVEQKDAEDRSRRAESDSRTKIGKVKLLTDQLNREEEKKDALKQKLAKLKAQLGNDDPASKSYFQCDRLRWGFYKKRKILYLLVNPSNTTAVLGLFCTLYTMILGQLLL